MGRRKKDPRQRVTGIGATVLPSVKAEVKTIAENIGRSEGWVAGKFLLRGLVRYRADGKLTEEESPKPSKRTSASRPSPADIRYALATALGFNGQPMTDKDRETIRKFLETGDDAQEQQKFRQRRSNRAKRA